MAQGGIQLRNHTHIMNILKHIFFTLLALLYSASGYVCYEAGWVKQDGIEQDGGWCVLGVFLFIMAIALLVWNYGYRNKEGKEKA